MSATPYCTVLYCDLSDQGYTPLTPVYCWTKEQTDAVLASAKVEMRGIVSKDGTVVITEGGPNDDQGV